MYPPIHHAAYLGKKDDLRAELDKGVSPDLAYTEEWSHHDKTGAITVTPLHRLLETLRDYSLGGPTEQDELACLNLLLAAGANPNLAQLGDFGHVEPGVSRTPLQLAVRAPNRSAEFVARLLAAGADVNARGSHNLTALHTAAQEGSLVDCVRLLIDAGANVNALASNGWTPLDTAFASADEYMDKARGYTGGKGRYHFEGWARRCHCVATILLRADARTAVYSIANISDPYVRRVLGAGGFKRYERAHLTALTATFAPKFPALPTDAVRVVVAFCFHVGYY